MTRQETINKAVAWALEKANNPAYGYDQQSRWGPNYDCSSFVISAWEAAGVPVRQKGASYTGNMYLAFLNCGFRDVTDEVNRRTGAGLVKGDVLLNAAHHTEMYIGNGQNVKASINEHGGVTGGQSGDQTGREIYVGPYYMPSYGWDYVLRYMGSGVEDKDTMDPEPEKTVAAPSKLKGDYSLEFHVLKYGAGMTGQESLREEVRAMQQLLIAKGFDVGSCGADGEFGGDTKQAVIAYQESKSLKADGEVGPETMGSLLGVSP